MRFKIRVLPPVLKDLKSLPEDVKNEIEKDFDTIENLGIEYVKRRFLRDGLFEVKSGKGRSFFKYAENQIIWIGYVYEKKSQKAPERFIKVALKRLEEAGL